MPSLSLLSRLYFRLAKPPRLAVVLVVASWRRVVQPRSRTTELREQVVAVTAAHELLTFTP